MKKICRMLLSALLSVSMMGATCPFGVQAAGGMAPLSSLTGLNGTWQMGTVIRSDGSGDLFALSNSRATDFVFEADVEFVRQSGAASLVFLSGDTPGKGAYVANIDLSVGNARIFRFESTGSAVTKGEYKLTADQRARSTFHLRVEVSGENMIYLIDGVPVVKVQDADAGRYGDRLGLLTYNTAVNYTNVQWAPMDESAPALSALTGTDTAFSGQIYMKQTLSYQTRTFSLAAAPADGATLTATAKGTAVPTVLQTGNRIRIDGIDGSFDLLLCVSKDGISRNYVVAFKVQADPDSVYTEQWRPQLHFTAYENWINDPNGLVYDPSDGRWHMFFQYNPYGLNIGNQVWGHAVSDDLMHWEELDIAIPQDHLGAVFSGSAVVDENNTTGFFDDNQPGESKLVALYTSDGGDTTHGVEKQCIAYSKDHGVTWIRPNLADHGFENPIISNAGHIYGRDFRDPKIFWHDGKWFMVVAGGRARLFTSDDLINWTLACDMGFDSECPDFYPLAVDGNENNIKWVYTASGKWYVIGRLEKVAGSQTQYRFVAEGDRLTYNGGGEVYATQSFYNDGTGAGRRIAVSWNQDWSAGDLPGKTWNGAMTLPYEQTLRTVGDKILLCSYPVAELDALRAQQVIDLTDPTVHEATRALAQNPGIAYDAQITFKPAENAVVTFTLRAGGNQQTQVIYDGASHALRVIRARSSVAGGSIRSGTMEMPLYPDGEGKVTLRMVMDTTVLEVFGNGGEAACAGMIFPGADSINNSMTVDGQVEICALEMWRMTSVWHKDDAILPEAGLYLDGPTTLPLSEPAAFCAYRIDEQGNRVDGEVTWDAVDSALATVISAQDGLLKLQGKSEGELRLTASIGALSKTWTVKVAAPAFRTNLNGWTSKGDWFMDANGWSLTGSNGDSFTFSNQTHSGAFTYRGVADFGGAGGCLGLVFGATHPADPSSGTWYGANIDTHGAQPVMKLFCNTGGQEVWAVLHTFETTADQWTLELSYTDDGQLIYTVGGHSVSRAVGEIPDGRLGLVSWSGGGSFNQVVYTPARSALMGDVAHNGAVDVADIMKLKALIMADKWSDEELAVGDMDGSGMLDVGDIMAIKNIIMTQ